MAKSIVVIGAGPGLGTAIARKFGTEGYEVILVARNDDHLQDHKQELAQAGISARTLVADVTDIAALDQAIADIQSHEGDPDVVVYNVGVTMPDENPLTPEDLLRRFGADVVGAYETIDKFATAGFAEKQGAILLTGGGFALHPYPGFLSLSMDKAALRNLAQAEHDILADKGIYVGTVTICDTIGSNDHFAPDNIAEAYWKLNQDRNGFEVLYQ